jgi:hypothetical protein
MAALNVHIANGPAWWLSFIGPVLAAVTAIAAAAIAARTANRRQREQLAHDRALQSDQLAYDREQRNRAHARDALDDAIAGADAAIQQLAQWRVAIFSTEDRRSELREAVKGGVASVAEFEELKGETAKLHQEGQDLYDASILMTSQGLRLGIRLGLEHPLVKAHDDFGSRFSERHELLQPLTLRAAIDEDREALDKVEQADTIAFGVFVESCEHWLLDAEPQVNPAESRRMS